MRVSGAVGEQENFFRRGGRECLSGGFEKRPEKKLNPLRCKGFRSKKRREDERMRATLRRAFRPAPRKTGSARRKDGEQVGEEARKKVCGAGGTFRKTGTRGGKSWRNGAPGRRSLDEWGRLKPSSGRTEERDGTETRPAGRVVPGRRRGESRVVAARALPVTSGAHGPVRPCRGRRPGRKSD